jgi:serine/threonine-protein kinase HipA
MRASHNGYAPLAVPANLARFDRLEVTAVLAEVVVAVKQWRDVALTADVGLSQAELEDFAPAFEHAGLEEALAMLA